MKVYLDECVDWRLARDLRGHETHWARGVGWLGVKNGELLQKVEAAGFDAFVTTDRKLPAQNNVAGRRFALFVLVSSFGRYSDLRELVPDLLGALSSSRPGTVTVIEVDRG